jgi:hypothetical protein
MRLFRHGAAPVSERGEAGIDGGGARFREVHGRPRPGVLDSGTLALSSGPVRNPRGELSARFSSVWRREVGGWRIVFNKGSPVCNCAAP